MGELLNSIYAKLKAYRAQTLKAEILFGLFVFIAVSSSLFFLFTLSELLLRLSSVARTVLFIVWMTSNIGVAGYFILLPLIRLRLSVRPPAYLQLARAVGRHFHAVEDHLANILQLVSAGNNQLYSASLTRAALEQIYNKIGNLDFRAAASFEKPRKLLRLAAGGAVFILLITIFIAPLNQAAGRLLQFSREFVPPPKYMLKVVPGNVRVTKGESVKLTVLIFGGAPPGVNLYLKTREQNEYQQVNVPADSAGDYIHMLRGIRTDMEYYAEREGIRSETHTITVVDRPLMQLLVCKVRPPAYSGLPASELRDNGNIVCLHGSVIEFSLQATKPLSKAFLVLDDSLRTAMAVAGENAAGSLRATGDVRYTFELRDEENNANDAPVAYTVKTIADQYPAIELISPKQNVALSSEQRLPLHFRIADDFGFSSVRLYYRLSASRYEKPQEKYTAIDIPWEKGNKEQEIHFIWNLSPLSLATEDALSYYIETADNDNVSGPKKARTAELTARIPSLDELFSENDKQQSRAEKDLQKTLEEAVELKRDMEKLQNELRKDQQQVSWEEKQKAKQAVERFNKLQEQVKQVQKQLSESVSNMRENNLLSKETLEKYMELQELMKEMRSEDMRKAMERMQQALQNLDRKQIQDALQNMKFDEDTFKKSIERTLNLLKRIQIEQKVDELIKRSEELEREQTELAEQAEKQKNDKNAANRLSKEQKRISEKLKQLEREMKELSDKMKDFSDLPNDEMKDIEKEFDEQKNEELSEQASEDLEKSNTSKAQQQQQQVARNMKKMAGKMKGLQSSIMKQQQMKVLMDMMRLLNDLIDLSKQQEELKKQSAQGEREMPLRENARRQDELRSDLDRLTKELGELAQKTFAVSPEMGKEIGDAHRSMDQAVSSLQNRNQNEASARQGDAMKSLNQAASMMKDAMENMMQQSGQGGSGGMMSLMQQLGKLSGQQMNLNNLAQQLMRGNGGQLSQEQMGQLQRLAQQQELVKKSLEQLEKEARSSGQSKKIPADLDRIAKEMEEVVSEMRTQKLNNDIIQKQERILSKLLDAQRSINERDYEKDRESFSGTNQSRPSPPQLPNQNRSGDPLQDELRNAVREGYSRDYQELIRKYFEKLQGQRNK